MMNIGCSNQSLESLNILSLSRSTYPVPNYCAAHPPGTFPALYKWIMTTTKGKS